MGRELSDVREDPQSVEEILPQLMEALALERCAVLQAPPGTGKTTRVPLALLGEDWLAGKRILMLEPRRLAASNAARFMAQKRGERVGETIGYAIRFDRRVSPRTRVEVVTEGILARRLQSDPLLEGVGLVIFDEFHERNLHSDLALALCRDVQQGLRDDLRLLVMSATLDAEPVSRLLGDAPLLTTTGHSHPLEIRYLERDPGGPVAEETARSVETVLRRHQGDVLVFLPGAAEIRRCADLLESRLEASPVLLCPLYGNLPFAAQERAILPQFRRKVVLATNIAETSLTIEGVQVVIDSGLARRVAFDAASATSRLETERISAASATQRAGRAARLGPGICYRLWTEATQGSLRAHNVPEIRRTDLCELALDLALWGIDDSDCLSWLDPPPAGALTAARKLLVQLGALDDRNRITPQGRAMAELGAHPRLAAMMLLGSRRQYPRLACRLAAVLSEQVAVPRREPGQGTLDSDLLEDLARLNGCSSGPNSAASHRRVVQAAEYWLRRLGEKPEPDRAPSVEQVSRLLAAAFPDRIAAQREPGSRRYLLANGRGVRLGRDSAVRAFPFLVAVEVFGGDRREGEIRRASRLEREWIEQDFQSRLIRRREVDWDEREQRVVAREIVTLDALVLAQKPVRAEESERMPALLQGLRRRGLEGLGWSRDSRQFLARLRFVADQGESGEWPQVSDEKLSADLENWLAPYLSDCRTLEDLARFDPLPALHALLDWRARQRLDTLAPTHLEVPSGSRVRVDYGPEGPVLAVKLQELFGLAGTPAVLSRRIPVTIHLLSPARRPLAVTQDLRSFWDNIYPEVKKELAGRYPKHPWPDDPWNAVATRATRPRNKKR
jgi:ATP-dependent helicase HrpB